jgi:hypothetical protein
MRPRNHLVNGEFARGKAENAWRKLHPAEKRGGGGEESMSIDSLGNYVDALNRSAIGGGSPFRPLAFPFARRASNSRI